VTAWHPDRYIDEVMDRLAKPCIRAYRPYPPPRERRGRSKFGGLPNLPADVEWPDGHEHFGFKRGRIPLHFMAQIDCSELPRTGTALPSSGVLFFFSNNDDAADWMTHPADHYRRVLYVPDVAADTPERQPPTGLPRMGTASLLDKGAGSSPYPLGWHFGHRPDDPRTGRIYFEWPMQFVVTDSYPHHRDIRETGAMQGIARLAVAATAGEARGSRWDEAALCDYYQDYSSDRHVRNFYAALGLPEPPRGVPPRTPKMWREADRLMHGAFPPTAAFISEIATAIDNKLRYKADDEQQRPSHRQVPSPANDNSLFDRLAGRIRGILGLRPSPHLQPALPADWLEDIEIVRREAAEWLTFSRALAPDYPIDPETRARFLAWLDGFEDNGFARIPGHKPPIDRIDYIFDMAMFQLGRLAPSHPEIRAHFPDELYRLYHHMLKGAHHQMLGHFPCSQQPTARGDDMVPLLSLAWDEGIEFSIGDVGEMQFFIDKRDLERRDFRRVEAQMQGG
jgi:uncharacterized protein YwqG